MHLQYLSTVTTWNSVSKRNLSEVLEWTLYNDEILWEIPQQTSSFSWVLINKQRMDFVVKIKSIEVSKRAWRLAHKPVNQMSFYFSYL